MKNKKQTKHHITLTKPFFAVYSKTITAKNTYEAQEKLYDLITAGLVKPNDVLDKTKDSQDCFIEVRK